MLVQIGQAKPNESLVSQQDQPVIKKENKGVLKGVLYVPHAHLGIDVEERESRSPQINNFPAKGPI